MEHTMKTKDFIEIKDVFKSYKTGPQKVEVLRGINLVIAEREVAIIIGPSGVGKSTLLHIIGALDLPTSGEVRIAGQNINALTNDKLAHFRNHSIGFIFQFHHLLPEFSALENVLIPAMMHQKVTAEHQEYARFLLSEVGLDHRMEHRPNELSGGEQQRVAVARALINKPKVLLADEPTGNLDKRNSEALFDMLLGLNHKLNQTLVVVTHEENMSQNARRVIELDDGRVV